MGGFIAPRNSTRANGRTHGFDLADPTGLPNPPRP
jgi:hypothetical protein